MQYSNFNFENLNSNLNFVIYEQSQSTNIAVTEARQESRWKGKQFYLMSDYVVEPMSSVILATDEKG